MTRRHVLVFGCALLGMLVLDASPAGAHGTGGPPASNFHSVLHGVQPAARGVEVRFAADGEQLELEVTDDALVTVIGYDNEPYLRITEQGVSVNRNSRATRINRSRIPGSTPVPRRDGPPRWERVSTRPVVRWHDHRAHWMGVIAPEAVRRDPDHSHRISTWSVPIRVNGRPAAIDGELRWVPPPHAWTWWLVAVAVAATALVGFGSRRRGLVLAAGLGVMAVAEAIHVWGSWPFTPGSAVDRFAESIPSLAAVAACLGALAWLRARGPQAAAPGILIAGLFVAISGGFADLSVLSHSWVPSRLDPTVARIVVAFALGLGTAMTIFGITHLRPAAPDSDPSPVTG